MVIESENTEKETEHQDMRDYERSRAESMVVKSGDLEKKTLKRLHVKSTFEGIVLSERSIRDVPSMLR